MKHKARWTKEEKYIDLIKKKNYLVYYLRKEKKLTLG